jgi:hypothetical protein
VRLLLAFGLLASVPIHETVQNVLEWPNPVIYGLRAVLEEGTEIIAMLIFVSVTQANSVVLMRTARDFFVALVHWGQLIALIALVLWLPLTAATFYLPQPGGPADWLAASLFLISALLATRSAVIRNKLDWRSVTLVLYYLAASAAANAVSFAWDPVVFGVPVGLRGLVFAHLLVGAVAILRANQRRINSPRALLIAAVIAVCGLVWPTSQLLWCGLPPALALWLYSIEARAAVTGGATVRNNVDTPVPPAVCA